MTAPLATPLKAYRIIGSCFVPPYNASTTWARSRGAARMDAARSIVDAGWFERVGDVLPKLRVLRDARLDDPKRVIDPRLSPEDVALMEHAIGHWTGRPGTLPHRNGYCDSVEHPVLSSLIERGLMARGKTINDGRDYVAFVTSVGFEALGLPEPANT